MSAPERPSERSLRMMLEHPAVLDYVAAQLYYNTECDGVPDEGETWFDINEWDRIQWREKAIELQRRWNEIPSDVQEVVQAVEQYERIEDRTRRQDATTDSPPSEAGESEGA